MLISCYFARSNIMRSIIIAFITFVDTLVVLFFFCSRVTWHLSFVYFCYLFSVVAFVVLVTVCWSWNVHYISILARKERSHLTCRNSYNPNIKSVCVIATLTKFSCSFYYSNLHEPVEYILTYNMLTRELPYTTEINTIHAT